MTSAFSLQNSLAFDLLCFVCQGQICRDPDSLRAALSLGGEAPAWKCSLGRFLSLGKSSPRGRLWQCAHPQPLSPLQGRLAPRSEGKARAELRQHSGTTQGPMLIKTPKSQSCILWVGKLRYWNWLWDWLTSLVIGFWPTQLANPRNGTKVSLPGTTWLSTAAETSQTPDSN